MNTTCWCSHYQVWVHVRDPIQKRRQDHRMYQGMRWIHLDVREAKMVHYFPYPTYIDLVAVCKYSNIFKIRKIKSKIFYKSTPIRFDQHESTEINCTIIFAFYRKCFLARYLVGGKRHYDSLFDKCLSEELDPYFKIN